MKCRNRRTPGDAWNCTLPAGHDGPHQAHLADGTVGKTWETYIGEVVFACPTCWSEYGIGTDELQALADDGCPGLRCIEVGCPGELDIEELL